MKCGHLEWPKLVKCPRSPRNFAMIVVQLVDGKLEKARMINDKSV